MKTTSIRISADEFENRKERLCDFLKSSGSSGAVLFDNYYIMYYSGFAFIPTERPIAFLMNVKGESGLYVPRLELEHAESDAFTDRVDCYYEYPFDPHPEAKIHLILTASSCNWQFKNLEPPGKSHEKENPEGS